MKVIFLDVDGVLNSSRSVLARLPCQNEARAELERLFKEDGEIPYGPKYTLETLDPVAVGLVNRLAKEAGAQIVLSTSHRAMFLDGGILYGGKQHMHMLRLYFKAMGIEAPIYGITPKLHVQRGAEVKKWLDDHRQLVTHYVILDDGKDFHPSQPLVWCDPHVGFSHANYFAASKELGLAESSLIY